MISWTTHRNQKQERKFMMKLIAQDAFRSTSNNESIGILWNTHRNQKQETKFMMKLIAKY